MENVIDMTTRTGNIDVLTCQFKRGQIVVEGGRGPAAGRVAGATVSTELAVMIVVLLVAGIAVRGCAMEDLVDMTARTGNCSVLAC